MPLLTDGTEEEVNTRSDGVCECVHPLLAPKEPIKWNRDILKVPVTPTPLILLLTSNLRSGEPL